MANEEQLAILRQGVGAWNKWREENPEVKIDLTNADLTRADLENANFTGAFLSGTILDHASLSGANLTRATFHKTDFSRAALNDAKLYQARFLASRFQGTLLSGCKWAKVKMASMIFADSNLSMTIGLEDVQHYGPSSISTDTFVASQGKISAAFLRGCGLRDWEIEIVKLYNPELTNDERSKILYRAYDLQASQALQISPLFISYSRADSQFVDTLGNHLRQRGIRYWRDIHEMRAGRIETQIDRGIRQNPTVLLVLSKHSLSSDWVEHEVRTARALEKEMERDVLCPVALDDSWKTSRWPQRIMEQIMEYNILDFSAWQDDAKFDDTFRRLIDGLGLFYKG